MGRMKPIAIEVFNSTSGRKVWSIELTNCSDDSGELFGA